MYIWYQSWIVATLIGCIGVACGEVAPTLSANAVGSEPDVEISQDEMLDGAVESDTTDSTGGEGAVDTADESDPALSRVDEWGPHRVGYTNFQLTYDSLNGVGDNRTVKVHVWYPTDATEGETVLYDFLAVDDIALGQAPPRLPAAGAGYPLLVHSHGHMAFGTVSYTLMDYFASHGWVAIAPDHTGNQPGIDRKTAVYYHRSGDISAVLDAVEEGHSSIIDIFGDAWLQSERVVMSGHSFGVFTCWSLAGALMDADALATNCDTGSLSKEGGCTDDDVALLLSDFRDERVVASIMMDGSIRRSFYGEDGHIPVDIPLLTMGGSGPTGHAKGVAAQYDSLSGMDVIFLALKGACHEHFGLKECNYSEERLPRDYGLTTWDDIMDFDEAYRVIGTYAVAFSRHHVLADDTPSVLSILSGETTVSGNVAFQRKFETE